MNRLSRGGVLLFDTMNDQAAQLVGGFVTADRTLEQEFEARLVESSTLAFRVAYGVLRQRQDAEDVAQEAFVKAVQVVIGRYQGEKKISSLPYTLTMNANNHANLRMGTKIPVVMTTITNVPKDVPQGWPVQYQDVGTNIDCSSTQLEDGRFMLSITVDDSSVYPDEPLPGGAKGNPSFRSFRASNTMILKNGETGQFTTATDKITGETVKVDVTLTVVK